MDFFAKWAVKDFVYLGKLDAILAEAGSGINGSISMLLFIHRKYRKTALNAGLRFKA